MLEFWQRFIAIIGIEAHERLCQEFAGEVVRIPKKLHRLLLIPIVKESLADAPGRYAEIAERYNLSVNTIRNYERWKVKDGKLLSPDRTRVYNLHSVDQKLTKEGLKDDD